ncbi:MAG TPA: helix-turn-helix domain-containing protein, partial [Thermoanaerobaculia bacterium]|nr:helix-turn-helix domain-containing protein [Thermoanaerobaculia bacterium]
ITREDVASAGGNTKPDVLSGLLAVPTLRDFREQAERVFLVHKLEENDWNVTQTAQAVDTPRSNLYKKMEQYDIRRKDSP